MKKNHKILSTNIKFVVNLESDQSPAPEHHDINENENLHYCDSMIKQKPDLAISDDEYKNKLSSCTGKLSVESNRYRKRNCDLPGDVNCQNSKQ